MRPQTLLLAVTIPILAILMGCEGPLTTQPYGYGSARRSAMERQIANPDAAVQNTEPIEGMDTRTAEGVSENYHYSEDIENQNKRNQDNDLINVEY